MNTFKNFSELRDEYNQLYHLNDMIGGKGKVAGRVAYHWYKWRDGQYERVGETLTRPAGAMVVK